MIKSAFLGLFSALALAPPATAQTVADQSLADTQQVADFLDYKRRLLALVAIYRLNVTTVADIEGIFGETFAPAKREVPPGWIEKTTPGYRSLRFQNRIDLYYGSEADKTIWRSPPYFEVQYYVNFEQDENINRIEAAAPASDLATCLSLTEFKAAFAARGVPLKFEEEKFANVFLVSTSGKDILVKGKIEVIAVFKPRNFDPNHEPMDISEGCLVSVNVG